MPEKYFCDMCGGEVRYGDEKFKNGCPECGHNIARSETPLERRVRELEEHVKTLYDMIYGITGG